MSQTFVILNQLNGRGWGLYSGGLYTKGCYKRGAIFEELQYLLTGKHDLSEDQKDFKDHGHSFKGFDFEISLKVKAGQQTDVYLDI